MRVRALLIIAALVLASTPILAKSYSAERFDVLIEIQDDGALRITETVVFSFDGRYSRVFREVSTRRTDGLEVLSASMDGVAMPFGDGVGQVEVSGRNQRKVEWRFPSVDTSVHTFVLTYLAHGVVRQTNEGDLLAWRALPSDHEYSVASSTVEIVSAVPPASAPAVRTRRVGTTATTPSDGRVVVTSADIRRDGWVEITMAFPLGALIQSPPGWQQQNERAAASAPAWIGAAAAVFLISLVPVFALRMRYDAPHTNHRGADARVLEPPDDLTPAMAGALVSNGQISTTHALATFYSLADHGVIRVSEMPRRLGQRRFEVRRTKEPAPPTPTDTAVLDAVFVHRGEREERVAQTKAVSRIARRMKPFRQALLKDLKTAGLLDSDRTRVRRLALAASVTLLVLAAVAAAGLAVLVQDYDGWPLLIAAGLFAGGITGLIAMNSMTPLSNEGARRAVEWRAYKRHLKDLAANRPASGSGGTTPALTVAVGLGLAAAWGKYLKRHPGHVPTWFEAAGTDVDGAFVAMLAHSSSTSGAGAGAGAGAAAGGGASGAS